MKYKILIVCDNLLPPAINLLGVKNIYNMLKKITTKNLDIHILTSIKTQPTKNWLEWIHKEEAKYHIKFYVKNIPFKKLVNAYSTLLRTLFFIYGLLYQVICKYNIIHEYSSSPVLINGTYLLGRLTRAKTVHTICTVNKGLFGSTSLALRSTDRVICVTDGMRKRLEKRLSRQKIDVIPIPIDDRFFHLPANSSQKKFGIRTNKAVLFCGLLDRRKGITSFLKAIPEVIEKNPDTSIVIVTAPGLNTFTGARQNRDRVLSVLKHYGGRVIFIEKEIDMPSLFAAIDVFVYPLLTMHGTLGSPSVLIEAMATGKAIMASNLREVSDIIIQGKNGLLFNPMDSKELAQCVNKLLKDRELREQLGKEAKRTSHNYSLTKVSNDLVELYRDLVRNNEKKEE